METKYARLLSKALMDSIFTQAAERLKNGKEDENIQDNSMNIKDVKDGFALKFWDFARMFTCYRELAVEEIEKIQGRIKSKEEILANEEHETRKEKYNRIYDQQHNEEKLL